MIESFESDPSATRHATVFLDELNRRYGRFMGCEARDEDGSLPPMPDTPVSYTLHFEDIDVEAEMAVVLSMELDASLLSSRLRYLRVIDHGAGNLVYPGGEPKRIANHP